MSAYYRGGFLEDSWVYIPNDASLPESGVDVIVSLARWRNEISALTNHKGKLGVSINPDDQLEKDTDTLTGLSLISISFPKFSDGRGYSQARMLREQFGFKGEIRARGEVLMDQIPLMMRCGIEAFEITHEPTIAAMKAEALPAIFHSYQSPVCQQLGNIRRFQR